MNTERKIILAGGHGYIMSKIEISLEKSFPDYQIDISTINDIDDFVEASWLIIWENTQPTYEGGISEAVHLAQNWLTKYENGRAIIVTNSNSWDTLNWKFNKRLLGIPLLLLDTHHFLINEMINAGDLGCGFIPPTVINLSFDKDCCLKDISVSHGGPLYGFLRQNLEPINDAITRQEILANRLEDIDFQKLLNKNINYRDVLNLAHNLSNDFFNELVQKLKNITGLALNCFWSGKSPLSSDSDFNSPCPIHLHISFDSQSDILAVPLDIVRNGEESGFEHLCTVFPVVWRPNRNSSNNHTYAEENLNINEHKHDEFHGIYSCESSVSIDDHKFSEIEGAKDHINDILSIISHNNKTPIFATNRERFRSSLIRQSNETNSSVYILTHGFHCDPEESASVVIGPDGAGMNGERANAIYLEPYTVKEEFGVTFAYFNCCELAFHTSYTISMRKYFAGFADAAMKLGVCREGIFNRWSVTAEYACILAKEFHRMNPITVHGRANALRRARIILRKKMAEKEDIGQQLNPTWLAPMHLWTETRKLY